MMHYHARCVYLLGTFSGLKKTILAIYLASSSTIKHTAAALVHL